MSATDNCPCGHPHQWRALECTTGLHCAHCKAAQQPGEAGFPYPPPAATVTIPHYDAARDAAFERFARLDLLHTSAQREAAPAIDEWRGNGDPYLRYRLLEVRRGESHWTVGYQLTAEHRVDGWGTPALLSPNRDVLFALLGRVAELVRAIERISPRQ